MKVAAFIFFNLLGWVFLAFLILLACVVSWEWRVDQIFTEDMWVFIRMWGVGTAVLSMFAAVLFDD